jgi:uncharacterized protein YggE
MNHDHFSFDDVFSTGYVRIAVTGVLAILALFLLVETLATAFSIRHPSTPPADTITVSGQGSATVVPDVAKIDYSVTEDAKSVADAQTAATTKSNAALAALAADGIADKDVKTIAYNVSPQYSYPTCPPGVFCPNSSGTITGYEVSQTLEVTVRDTSKAGDVLQKLGSLGVSNISGPNFTVDDPTTVESEARADAINKAKASAALLAAQLGVHLGRIVNFYEDNGAQPPAAYGVSAMTSGKAAAPVLPTGENETTSSVSITFEID